MTNEEKLNFRFGMTKFFLCWATAFFTGYMLWSWKWWVSLLAFFPTLFLSWYVWSFLTIPFQRIASARISTSDIESDEKEPEVIDYIGGLNAFEKGKSFYFNQDFEGALDQFDVAVVLGYWEGDVFSFRASCLQAFNYHFDAIEDYDKAIIESPNDSNLVFGRATSKSAVRDFEGSIADLEKAIELAGKNLEVNIAYEQLATDKGYKNSSTFYLFQLEFEKSRLEDHVKQRKLEENCQEGEFKESLKESRLRKEAAVARMRRPY